MGLADALRAQVRAYRLREIREAVLGVRVAQLMGATIVADATDMTDGGIGHDPDFGA